MKIIFLGTPVFASKVLKGFLNTKHKIVAVVTGIDKPKGRSKKPVFNAVKKVALENNLKVLQYKNIKNQKAVNELKSLNADVMITCAYGQLLDQKVLDITKHGVYNVHGSLLPKYRGPAPVQWAVINGDSKTGVTIMKTALGMDTGDMLIKKEIEINTCDTAGDIFEKMVPLSVEALKETLILLENGTAKENLQKQDKKQATYAPKITKENSKIDFSKTAKEVVSFIHGLNPTHMAYTFVKGIKLDVFKASLFNEQFLIQQQNSFKLGQVVIASAKKGLVVKVKNGFVRLEQIKLAGKKQMADTAFLNGKQIEKGTKLGE